MKDLLEFVIPQWAICPLINADNSAMNEEEEQQLKEFNDHCIKEYGNACFMLPPNEEDMELGFCHSNDVDSYAGDCSTLVLMSSK